MLTDLRVSRLRSLFGNDTIESLYKSSIGNPCTSKIQFYNHQTAFLRVATHTAVVNTFHLFSSTGECHPRVIRLR